MAYISALPPLSECDANTRASDQSTLCVQIPILRMPERLFIIAADCHISCIYPPLKPKGRINGSRSKFESTSVIVIVFSGFFSKVYTAIGELTNRPAPETMADVLIKSLLEIVIVFEIKLKVRGLKYLFVVKLYN
jgi:hypothetical protein